MGFRRGEKILFKSRNKQEVLDYIKAHGCCRFEVVERRSVLGVAGATEGSVLWYYAVGW